MSYFHSSMEDYFSYIHIHFNSSSFYEKWAGQHRWWEQRTNILKVFLKLPLSSFNKLKVVKLSLRWSPFFYILLTQFNGRLFHIFIFIYSPSTKSGLLLRFLLRKVDSTAGKGIVLTWQGHAWVRIFFRFWFKTAFEQFLLLKKL